MPEHTEAPASLHPLIRDRWSPRAFSDRLLTIEQIRALLEAARWAPSSSNEQPWSYILATRDDPAEFERLASCLVEGNAIWAKQAPPAPLGNCLHSVRKRFEAQSSRRPRPRPGQ